MATERLTTTRCSPRRCVNLHGTMFGIRAALRVTIGRGGGSIVDTASNAGLGAAADHLTPDAVTDS